MGPFGPEFESKLKMKMEELRRGIKREGRSLEKESSRTIWCINSPRWGRTKGTKLVPRLLFSPCLPSKALSQSGLSRWAENGGRFREGR